MNVLMVGVDNKRVGGMWTVAENYLTNEKYNNEVKLFYYATSTNGPAVMRGLKMLTGYIRIILCLLTKKVDLLHIHMADRGSTFRKGFIAVIGKKIFRKKVIVQLHGGPFMDWFDTLPQYKQKIIKKIFLAADKVLVLGKYWKEEVIHIIPEGKLEVFYNGSYCPDKNQYNAEGKLIIYMGVLRKEKGIYDLIKAIKCIEGELDSDVFVYLCGIDLEGNIQEIIQENELQKKIVLPGWIDKAERLRLFADAQICVLPSYYEALSMTVIEAMCYGIPVVTTSISTMPELLGQEIDTVNPGDYKELAKKILELSKDKELRSRISEIEYRRARKNFSIETNIENTLDLYRKISKNS